MINEIYEQMHEDYTPSLRRHYSQLIDCSSTVWDPNAPLRLGWDMLSLFFILLSLVLLPLEMSFEQIQPDSLNDIDMLTNVFFLVDIIVMFNTGLYREGKLIRSRKIITGDYLKFWFWLDLMSSLPYESLNFSSLKALSFFRFLKFIKVLRVMRVAKLKVILRKVQENLDPSLYTVLEFLKLCSIIVLIVHWCSCLFNLATYGQYGYLDCFYFSITTMITVGYGDISAKDTDSRTYVVFAMILANGVFGYALNSTVAIFASSASPEEQTMLDSQDNVNKYLRQHNCSADLKSRINEYLDWMIDYEQVARSQTIMQDLSQELYLEVQKQIMKQKIQRLPVQFNSDMMTMKECILLQEEEITDAQTLFYLQTGDVGIYGTGFIADADKWFGEVGFFSNLPRTAKLVTKSICSILKISRADFLKHLNKKDFLLFHKIKNDIEMNNNIIPLKLKCLGCQSDDHVVKYCPKLHYIPDIKIQRIDIKRRKCKRKRVISQVIEYFDIMHKRRLLKSATHSKVQKRQRVNLEIDNYCSYDDESCFAEWNVDRVIAIYNYMIYVEFKKDIRKRRRYKHKELLIESSRDMELQLIQSDGILE